MTDDEIDAVRALANDLSVIAAGTARLFLEDRMRDIRRHLWKDLSPRQSAFLWQLVYQYRALPYVPRALVEIAKEKRFCPPKRAPPPTRCCAKSSRFG